jgi:hypothetical protein
MMVWAVHDAPRPIGLATLCVVCSTISSYRVIAPTNCAYEGSATRRCTVVHHCSRVSACLRSHDNVVYPHILEALW